VNRFFKYGIALAAIGLLFCACKKEDPTLNYPKISNIEVMPDTVVEFADTVIISFDYEDHNGDLGFQDPNTPSITVKDSRLENPDYYHLQPLAPLNVEVPIQGRLQIKLNNLFIIGNADTETLNLKVQLKDREGNLSNELTSGDIIVVR